MAGHVYHWKHGWIPLDHAAASLKAHGDNTEAHKLLVNAEVAKVAAGEKDVKHAQRTIDHAHGYAGKSVSELSDNQLKHEQLRAKDMHRFATGEEDKRAALAHHKEVQAELEKRGHKTGRSVPGAEKPKKADISSISRAELEARRREIGSRPSFAETRELEAINKELGRRTQGLSKTSNPRAAAKEAERSSARERQASFMRSSEPDASLRDLAKNFRPGDRVTGTDAHGNTVTGRLEHPSTATRLKKARPFPGQKPFDTPGPRYDNTWMIKKDDGGLVRVAPHSVDKIGDNPDSRPASGSNVRGGLADLGRLQSSKPSHVKAAEQIKGAQEAASESRIKPGKLKKGDVVEHPQTGKPVEVGEIHNVIGGSRAAGSGKYVISDTNGHQIAEMSPNSSLKRAAKPEHVRAAEQIKGAQEADRIRHNKSGDTIMVSKVKPGDLVSKQGYPKGHPKSQPRRVISIEHGRTGGGNPRRDITVEHPKTGERSVIENVAPNSALNFHGTGEVKPEHVRAAEQFAGAKAEADRRRAGQAESHNPFKVVEANSDVKSMSDTDLRAERLSLNKKGLLSAQEETRLSALDAEIRNRNAADDRMERERNLRMSRESLQKNLGQKPKPDTKVTGTGSEQAAQKLAKAASAEPKSKKVVGAPAGHQLIDTGKKSAGASSTTGNVIELRTDTGHTVGTLERVERQVPIMSGHSKIASGFKKETSWRLTYLGQGGGSPEYSYEKTRARAAADLLRRAKR